MATQAQGTGIVTVAVLGGNLHDRVPVLAPGVDIAIFSDEQIHKQFEVAHAHALVGFEQHVEIFVTAVVGAHR